MKVNFKKIFLILVLCTLMQGTFNMYLFVPTAFAWNCGETLTDSRDNKTYPTVLIGTQCWTAANMNIGTMTSGGNDQGTDCPSAGAIEKYCYDNSEANCTAYGGLYQWNQMMCGSTTEGVQGICPIGWHIPTDAEQYTLENYLKDLGQTCNATRSGAWECATAGTKLKSGGISGFNGLLAGYRYFDGSFELLSSWTFLWSSTQVVPSARYRALNFDNATVSRDAGPKSYGLSVRCLRDPNIAPTLTSISDSPDPIKGGSTITITPTGQGDTESSSLYYYCNEAGTAGGQAPTSANTLCTQANTSYASPYSTMTCTYAVTTGDTTRTVYCRTYDGTDYSTERTTTYTVDTTAPTITITNPNTNPATSKTITANTSDGTLTMSNTTGSTCDGTLTFTTYASQTFTSEANNGTKVCYKATDALSNTSYSLSDAIAGIDTTAPTLSFTDNVAVGPVQSDTITATWGDATVTKWDYDTDGVCSTTAGDYTNSSTSITTQIAESNNTKYICLYAEDSLGNKSTLASVNDINIDVTAPAVPTATPEGTAYSSTQSVTLASLGSSAIYYTTNGDAPTTSSTLYTGAISIASTTTLKALAQDTATNESGVMTETYTINLSTSISGGGNANQIFIPKPIIQTPQTPQAVKQQLITELKAKLVDLIRQLIILLQEQMRNR